MKQRPRRCENEAASWLSEFSKLFGFKAIERVPVIGRTGPDLTINELKLVVDVKSRQEVPDGIFYDGIVEFDDLLAVPLYQAGEILEGVPQQVDYQSKIVRGYYNHMDKWRIANFPDGISALILHKPKMPFGKAMFIISKSDRSKLCQTLLYKIS